MSNFVMAIAVVISLLLVVFCVAILVATWKVYAKAHRDGWECIIPVWNLYALMKISRISPWWMAAYIIPFILMCFDDNLLYTIYLVNAYLYYNLAKAFGKGIGFTIGLVLLQNIFILILGFGSAEYQYDEYGEPISPDIQEGVMD